MDNEQALPRDETVDALVDEILGTPKEKSASGDNEWAAKLLPALSLLGSGKSAPPNKQTALLCALKPYLSPERFQMIDYITKLGNLGHLLKQIR